MGGEELSVHLGFRHDMEMHREAREKTKRS